MNATRPRPFAISRGRPSRTLWIASIVLVAGCLGSPPPSVRFLTLPPVGGAPSGEATALGSQAWGVGPVAVAPHLERSGLAYRIDATRVEFADSAQWAAPLDRMIEESMAAHLTASSRVTSVSHFPWPVSAAPDVQVTLRFIEFAIVQGGDAVLSVRWTLRDPTSGRSRASGTWDRTIPSRGATAADNARTLGDGLAALGEFLVEQVPGSLGPA